MAIRCKTIEYAFTSRTTTLAAGTRNDFSSITVYIPETASRTFLSVMVLVDYREDQSATGTDAGNRTIGIKLGAASFDDLTISETISSSFAPMQFSWIRDVTSYFTTNFGSGASQTCQVGIQQNTMITQSHTAKLVITYSYEDAVQDTLAKTVRIPLDSPITTLTNTLTEIGTNQIPVLTGGGSPFLPEASITVRDIWFEIWGCDESGAGLTDYNLALALDAEGEASMGTWESNQFVSRGYRLIWKRTDMTTTSAHAFKARTTTTGRCACPSILLCVTYEYSQYSSSTILNSLMMLMPQIAVRLPANDTSAEAHRSTLSFLVEEPGTVTLKQSAFSIRCNSQDVDAYTILTRAGSQSYRTYTLGIPTGSNSGLGDSGLMQRIDSGGAQGAGLTLARGENSLVVDAYSTTATADAESTPYNVMAMAFVNYHSDKHALGPEVHAHTRRLCLRDSLRTTGTLMLHTISYSPPVPEAQVWVVNAGVSANTFIEEDSCIFVQMEMKPGWRTILTNEHANGERQIQHPFGDVTPYFSRHTLDPDTSRTPLMTTRRWRVGITHRTTFATTSLTMSLQMYLTYSSMPIEAVRGVTPATPSLGVRLYRSDTRAYLYSATTKSTGEFVVLCHTDAIQHFGEAYVNGSSGGRSFDFAPTGFGWDSAWLPSGLSGLAIWLRDSVGITQSGTVSAWADQTANANNAAQGTGGLRPTYLADGGDGKAAISFDGTDDQLDITDAGSLGSTTAFSASVRIRTGATFPSNGTIIAQWGGTERFLMRVETGGNLVVSISNGSAGTATCSAVLAVSSWYLVTFTYDGSGTGNSGKLKVYINGALQVPSFAGTVPTSTGNPTTVLSLGSRNTASTYFNGYISEVVFVDGRAMTEDEILRHYWYRPRFG